MKTSTYRQNIIKHSSLIQKVRLCEILSIGVVSMCSKMSCLVAEIFKKIACEIASSQSR